MADKFKLGSWATDTPAQLIMLHFQIDLTLNRCTWRKMGVSSGYTVTAGKNLFIVGLNLSSSASTGTVAHGLDIYQGNADEGYNVVGTGGGFVKHIWGGADVDVEAISHLKCNIVWNADPSGLDLSDLNKHEFHHGPFPAGSFITSRLISGSGSAYVKGQAFCREV